MHLYLNSWELWIWGHYQGNFGMGYMNLASKFNEILEKDPRLDDDGQVMRFGNGY